MIKAYTAYTNEPDDTKAAVEQISSQLSLETRLLKNSVAIISCYADFVTSGVYEAVCKLLPCDVVGATTMTNTVRETGDDIVLTVMLLTSDDVSFATGLSEPITEEGEGPIRRAYEAAVSNLSGRPALILSYAPLLMNVGGDYFVKAFDHISGGIPNFGTIAVDHNDDYHEASVLYNGEPYSNRYAFILMSGGINPRYYVASISNEKVFQEKGVVTASKGNQLQTVNNMPVGDYLETLGFHKNEDGSITGINSFPFIMDLNDGMMPIVRVMFALTPEGYAVCGGDIPVGATLSVGSINATEVINTSEAKLLEMLKAENHEFILIYSCIGRYFSLGYDPGSEIGKIKEHLDETGIPYFFAYSGCEICPVYPQDGGAQTTNRSHNDTLVICAF